MNKPIKEIVDKYMKKLLLELQKTEEYDSINHDVVISVINHKTDTGYELVKTLVMVKDGEWLWELH